ncbi:MAG: hypothetical protein IKP24_04495 [Alphaproteobacteria bacterium]|nr:hypothetical protein [Alphaproteobacteria bacterium]
MKNKAKQFYSENILMSVAGHLLLIAIMITSIVVFVERAEMVTPDRVQITEIDLSNVKITGNDTKLYNTDAQTLKSNETQKIDSKPAPIPEPVADKNDKITDSFVDDDVKTKPKEPATQNKNDTKNNTNAPKKKTVIRVNREVLSLDRTLTVSVVDALRVAMTRCWTIDTNRPGLADIRAVAHLKMRPNGTVADVWFESAARAETDPDFAYVLDTIRAAIHTCEPLSMLPRNEYKNWESIQLTFYPISGRVM